MTAPAVEKPPTGAPAVRGRLLVAGLASAAAVAGGAAVLWFGGAVRAENLPGLAASSAVTPWALPTTRLVADAAAAVTVGCLIAAAFLVPAGRSLRPPDGLAEPATSADAGHRLLSPAGYRWVRAASWSALVWAVAAIAGVCFTLSDLVGLPVADVLTPTSFLNTARSIPQGQALAIVAVTALLVAVAARFILTASGAALLAPIALFGVLPPVFAGHAASSGNHQLAVSSLLVHVLAATLWCGGLVALVLSRRLSAPVRVGAVTRYSRLALWCCTAVGLSGAVNAMVRLGGLGAVLDTTYGRVVVAKAALFVLITAAGWWHRVAAIPALRAGRPGTFGRLAAAEVALLAAAFGVAAGLARTPPAGPAREETPAEALLGFPMPGPVNVHALLTDWLPEPLFLAAAALAIGCYLAGVRRLARRGDAWPVGRTGCWIAGWLLVVVVTSSGLARYGPVLFSVHMIQHMSMTMLGPILLVLGGPSTLALRALRPATEEGMRGPREWLLTVLHHRAVRLLGHPLVALAIYVTSLYAMYFTGLYELALRSHAAHLLMFAHFLGAGYLFFWILIGVDPAPRPLPYPARIPLLFASMVLHAFFGVALMQSDQQLAAAWFAELNRPWGPAALEDQRTGGGIAWAFGEIPSLLVVGALFFQWARADEREQRRLDRAADRADANRPAQPESDGGARSGNADLVAGDERDELAAYNAYLARLAEQDQRVR